jgi:hypothetical protein
MKTEQFKVGTGITARPRERKTAESEADAIELLQALKGPTPYLDYIGELEQQASDYLKWKKLPFAHGLWTQHKGTWKKLAAGQKPGAGQVHDLVTAITLNHAVDRWPAANGDIEGSSKRSDRRLWARWTQHVPMSL